MKPQYRDVDGEPQTMGSESGSDRAAALHRHEAAVNTCSWARVLQLRMTVALGTETQSGSRGLGRLPSLMAGCAELACQARSRAALYGARRGPDRPYVESASDDHLDARVRLSFFSCLFLFYSLPLRS